MRNHPSGPVRLNRPLAHSLPLTLELEGAGPVEPLVCEEMIRNLPGKRTVFAGHWKDQPVIVKVYRDRRRSRVHFRRELRGISALLRKDIMTPPLLYAGEVRSHGWSVIVSRRIEDASPGDSTLGVAGEAEHRNAWLGRLVSVLADHHRAGLRQTDLHLGNFLLSEGEIYSLDGAGFEARSRPLGRRASLANVALMLAQFPPDSGVDPDPLLEHYAKCRGWTANRTDRRLFHRWIRSHRERREREFLGKIYRECSAFSVCASGRLWGIFDRGFGDPAEWQGLLRDGLDFRPGRDRMLKDGNTCTVWLTERAGRRVVVKRYNLKSIGHRLGRAVRRTRASHSWENAHRLAFWGIGTPMPIGLVEERVGPLRGRAWFLSEYEDAPDLRSFLASSDTSDTLRAVVIKNVATLLRALSDLCISHGDMKATNILMKSVTPLLLDLDAMRRHRFRLVYKGKARRDHARYLRNWQHVPKLRALIEAELVAQGVMK